MREKREYNVRSAPSNYFQPRLKYIIVTEGTETEPRYFNAVRERKIELGIDPSIEIITCERIGKEQGVSNPFKLAQMVKEQICSGLKYKNIRDIAANAVKECFPDATFNSDLFISEILLLTNSNLEDEIEDTDVIEKMVMDIINAAFPELKLYDKNFLNYLHEHIDTWIQPEEGDKICIVVDRDKGSFKEEQYDQFLHLCLESGFTPFVTNPCFEFFLWLHSPHFTEKYDQEKIDQLHDNKRISKSKRALKYSESYLRDAFPKYTKKLNNVSEFVQTENIEAAIRNEKLFSEDVFQLKNKVGSNVGTLINELRTKKVFGI